MARRRGRRLSPETNPNTSPEPPNRKRANPYPAIVAITAVRTAVAIDTTSELTTPVSRCDEGLNTAAKFCQPSWKNVAGLAACVMTASDWNARRIDHSSGTPKTSINLLPVNSLTKTFGF